MVRPLWPASVAARRAQVSCWSRRDLLARSEAWMRCLSATLRRELSGSAQGIVDRPFGAWPTLGALPGLRAFADELRAELVLGSGLVFVAGLDARLEDRALRWAYLLLGAHIGQPMGPDGSLVEISGRCQTSPEEALADASPETRFHTDSFDGALPDVVGTLCLTPAPLGGEYQVTSAALAHEIVRLRGGADLVGELYQPFLRDHAGPGAAVFSTIGQRLHFNYTRAGIETGYQRNGRQLSPRQREGLDLLDEALIAPVARLQVHMRRGDLVFVNNWQVAHNRRPFVDHPGQRRRMVRMWLSLDSLSGEFPRI
jgi:hypothetical protein